jgi:predicted small lipoprotein YifL
MVRLVVLAMALALLSCAGCGREGPTYAESVQIYTAEMQELTRLQTERDKARQSYETRLTESSILDKDLNLSKKEIEWLKTGPIDELANKAMLQVEYTQWYNERVKRGEQLKDPAAETEVINKKRTELGLPIEPGIAREAQAHEAAGKVSSERDEVIAKLDKQIAEQQLRVDRAKAMRDQAEARSR